MIGLAWLPLVALAGIASLLPLPLPSFAVSTFYLDFQPVRYGCGSGWSFYPDQVLGHAYVLFHWHLRSVLFSTARIEHHTLLFKTAIAIRLLRSGVSVERPLFVPQHPTLTPSAAPRGLIPLHLSLSVSLCLCLSLSPPVYLPFALLKAPASPSPTPLILLRRLMWLLGCWAEQIPASLRPALVQATANVMKV